MSGSRGEANFVFRCKNCKVWKDNWIRYIFGGVQGAPLLTVLCAARVFSNHQGGTQGIRAVRAGQAEEHS